MNFLISSWWAILLSIVVGYLLGSMNSAVVITKIFTRGKDIRKMGSGNAGFTNVMRSVGTIPAVITMVCDLLKGIVSVLLGGMIFTVAFSSMSITANGSVHEWVAYGKYVAGFGCIVGHMFPIYFHFKGGKGALTAAALMLMVDYRVFIAVIAVFLIMFLITRIVSISTIIAAVLLSPLTFLSSYFIDYLPQSDTHVYYSAAYPLIVTAAALGIGAIIIIMHRENIKRLLKGEEKKLTIKKKTEK